MIAFNTPVPTNLDVHELVSTLLSVGGDQLDSSRMIYSWIIGHLRYQPNVEEGNEYSESNAKSFCKQVLESRIATANGFSGLFYEMATHAGLKCKIVRGSLNTIEGKVKHTWNALEKNGIWYFVDCTLGSGSLTLLQPSQLSEVFQLFFFDCIQIPKIEFLNFYKSVI